MEATALLNDAHSNEEGQKLRDEYNRILATTSFNGVKTLNGSQSSIAIQAGNDGVSAPLQLTAPSLGGTPILQSAYSLSLDGVNDYVYASSTVPLQITGDITVSAWVRIDTPNTGMFIAEKYDSGGDAGWILAVDTSGVPYLDGRDSSSNYRTSGLASPDIDDGEWHHLVGQRSGSTWKIYVDGAAGSSNNVGTSGSIANAIDLNIGRYQQGNSHFFDGRIDDVRIYNRALAESEIADLAAGDEPSAAGLVARYEFEQGAGTTAADSANGNTATLTGGATWSTETPLINIAGLETFSLLTASNARFAMDTIDSALSRLSGEVGKLGSQLSRLQTVISTISATRENYQAAAGRIKDADVAQESATLVRHQILQQTASGVLAQANQQPRIAIQLLGGI